MADKLRLGTEVRELKIGQSFTNTKSEAFHTIRYDFKPASVDINKIATVDVGTNNQVTVTVPHLDGAGVPQTVFKGSRRPFQKECVLIIDRVTGEITLEKLSSNMQVKKTRSESTKPQLPQDRGAQGGSDRSSSSLNPNRPATPPIGQRQSNKTRVTSGSRRADRQITHLVPKHSPLHASPNPNYPSPGHHKSPKRDRDTHTNNESHSALASLPLIGEDFSISPTSAPPPSLPPPQPPAPESMSSIFGGNSDVETNGGVGEMSDSSSSDSSSDSDSDHDSGPENKTANATPPQPPPAALGRSNGHSNGGLPPGAGVPPPHNKMSMPTQLLNEDLCLSESGSDSD